MKEKIYELFVAYKKSYDGNRPSFGYIAAQFGISRTAVKYHIDRDPRFKWVEVAPDVMELCIRGGEWTLV